jgi:DNA-binding winged helix-turn-helix (wHTH) protein
MSKQSRVYEFGPYRLEPAEGRLLRNGQEVKLTKQNRRLLEELVKARPHLVKKDTLIDLFWPDLGGEADHLSVSIHALRRAIGEGYIATVQGEGYRFVAQVIEGGSEGSSGRSIDPAEFAPPRGALMPGSSFYIPRTIDGEFSLALSRQDSFVLIKGVRQVGKTSLLARGLQQVRDNGGICVITDFQTLGQDAFTDMEKLFRVLAALIADELGPEIQLSWTWKSFLPPGNNLQSCLQAVLDALDVPFVWGIDEVDKLFGRPYANDVFALFRSWHNLRALKPEGSWQQCTVALCYATEAHLFISDLNQSPFNVGTRLLLEDFTCEQVAELNRRYGSPLKDREVARCHNLIGGHPYLAHYGIYWMAGRQIGLAEFESQADQDEGPFGDHLRRTVMSVQHDPELCEAVRTVLRGQPQVNSQDFHRLRAAGVLVGDSEKKPRLRCALYERYLRKRLL